MAQKSDEPRIAGTITDVGNTKENKTGSWRTFRPKINKEKCIACGQCELYCPEGAIWVHDADNKAAVDYDYCKGCGICAAICPVKAIEMIREEK